MRALILLALAAGLVVTTPLPAPAGFAHTQRVAQATTFAPCPGTLVEYLFEYGSAGSGGNQSISLACLSSKVEQPWHAYWVLQSSTGCYHHDAENDGCKHGWTQQLRHDLFVNNDWQEKPTQRYRMIRYALGRNCRAVQGRKDPLARSWSCKRYSFFAGDKAGALPTGVENRHHRNQGNRLLQARWTRRTCPSASMASPHGATAASSARRKARHAQALPQHQLRSSRRRPLPPGGW